MGLDVENFNLSVFQSLMSLIINRKIWAQNDYAEKKQVMCTVYFYFPLKKKGYFIYIYYIYIYILYIYSIYLYYHTHSFLSFTLNFTLQNYLFNFNI